MILSLVNFCLEFLDASILISRRDTSGHKWMQAREKRLWLAEKPANT